MKLIKPGDRVYHFLYQSVDGNHYYAFVGRSIAEGECQIIQDQPPKPDRWAGMSPYYRVPLANYVSNATSIPINQLFEMFDQELRTALLNDNHAQFFTEYRGKLRIAQAYLRGLSIDIGELFDSVAGSQVLPTTQSIMPTYNEPSYPDSAPPGTIHTTITRRIRDTALAREVKSKHKWMCAICGMRILLPNGRYYAEAHHIRPLGAGHNGLDRISNIIIVCPYHHAEFDYGAIGINPETWTICHIDSSNQFHGKETAYPITYLSAECVQYHYRKLFG